MRKKEKKIWEREQATAQAIVVRQQAAKVLQVAPAVQVAPAAPAAPEVVIHQASANPSLISKSVPYAIVR